MNKVVTKWDEIKRIIIVINYQSLEQVAAYRDAVKEIGLNINDCEIIAVIDKKPKNTVMKELNSVSYLYQNNIGLLGKVKDKHMQEVLKQRYDLLIVVDSVSKKVEKAFKIVKASNHLGINTDFNNLTINLSSDNTTPKHLLNFTKQILQKTI